MYMKGYIPPVSARSDGGSGQYRWEEGFICQTIGYHKRREHTLWDIQLGEKESRGIRMARLSLVSSWEGRDVAVSGLSNPLCASWLCVLIFNNGLLF